MFIRTKVLWGCIALMLTAVLAGTAAASSLAGSPTTRAVARYLAPTTMSASCTSDARRRAACVTLTAFFRAVNTRHYTAACTLFGERLRNENYGLGCPAFLKAGVPEPIPWGIVRTELVGPRIAAGVTVGQSELDHIRMRRYLAVIGMESGHLRILETKLVS